MESILAIISTLAILGGITAWAFAYKINRDWNEFYRHMYREKATKEIDIKTAAVAIKTYCKIRATLGGCEGCEFRANDSCGVDAYPADWEV